MNTKRKTRNMTTKNSSTNTEKQRGCRNSIKRKILSEASKPHEAKTNEVNGKSKKHSALNSRNKQSPLVKKKIKSNVGTSKLLTEGVTTLKRKQETTDDSGSPTKKAKLITLKKKGRRAVRQQKEKKNYNLTKKLKMLWEELRFDGTEVAKKQRLLDQTCALLKGHALELVFAHDTVRVIECVVTSGNDDQRTMLFEELKGSIILLAKSKYSKFFLLKMLQYGTKEQKQYILKQFSGKVIQLICHAEASSVLEAAFNEYANASQRGEMVQEFYGTYFKFFKDPQSSRLVDILNKHSDKRNNIIEHIQKVIENAIKKAAHKHSLVHHVLREFMNNADEKYRSEMIEQLRKYVVEILHTKDGSRVAMNCVWHGTAKDRKAVMKSFKGHVAKIAQEEFGHMVLLVLFDCIDDTKFIEKYIIKEISQDGNTICKNAFGKKVLLYLVDPRNSTYFHPDVVNILELGDKNSTSKKPVSLRRSELHDAAAPVLIKIISDSLPDNWRDNSFCLFTALLLNSIKVNCKDAFLRVAELAIDQEYFSSTSEDNEMHFIEQPSSNLLMKKLILSDDERMQKGYATFSSCLIEKAPAGRLSTWMHCNRGCFLLVNLLETKDQFVVNRVREEIILCQNLINSKKYKGANVLSQKLFVISQKQC